jgi:hypothetical protein
VFKRVSIDHIVSQKPVLQISSRFDTTHPRDIIINVEKILKHRDHVNQIAEWFLAAAVFGLVVAVLAKHFAGVAYPIWKMGLLGVVLVEPAVVCGGGAVVYLASPKKRLHKPARSGEPPSQYPAQNLVPVLAAFDRSVEQGLQLVGDGGGDFYHTVGFLSVSIFGFDNAAHETPLCYYSNKKSTWQQIFFAKIRRSTNRLLGGEGVES